MGLTVPPTLASGPKRLSHDERADQILDVASRIVVEEGLTALSMKRLVEDAGVSKTLVYRHFPSLTDVLCAMLVRENSAMRAQQLEAIKASGSDFEALIRGTTLTPLQHLKERGILLARLWSDPTVVAALHSEAVADREKAVRFFARRVHEEYGLAQPFAETIVSILLAVSTGLQSLEPEDGDPEFITDIFVSFLLGGVQQLASDSKDKGWRLPASQRKRGWR